VRAGKRAAALSEYGGIACNSPEHGSGKKAYGYGSAKTGAELTEHYKKLLLGTVLPQIKNGLSALVYTQLSDIEGEVNGLFTYDRAELKLDRAAVVKINAALEAEFERAAK